MARIIVQFENGDPEQVIDVDLSKAPFQHDGEPGSILDVLLAHGVPLEHACGGSCACTTCHAARLPGRHPGRALSLGSQETAGESRA
jgi:ferredoxin